MDDCSVQFDTFDSLDCLIPPVKKSHRSLRTHLLFSQDIKRQNDIRLMKDFRNDVTRQTRSPTILHEFDGETPSSVFKKTTKDFIHEYSFINTNINNYCNPTTYLPFNKDQRKSCRIEAKPMIKVTVTPKTTENQTSKVFNKRRERAKRIQSTVSNHESSIKSQNFYFMVKGKRREKVYEIKSTESTNLSNKYFNTKYEDISIQQITDSKRLIRSLNMEKKKQKNKKIEPNNYKMNRTRPNIKNYEESQGVKAQKSKVTIVGQLGLTRDDKYVLKCAATVNDKPIATNYVQLDSITDRNLSNIKRNAQVGQDLNFQTDLCNANNCINFNSKSKEHRNFSQATQVNFNEPKQKPPKGFRNKEVQCNCAFATHVDNGFNVRAQDTVLNDSKSPLVIISVYPRPYDKDSHRVGHKDSPDKIIQPAISPQKIANNYYTKSKTMKDQKRVDNVVSVNKYEDGSPRSRSPSPATKTITNKTSVNKTGNQVLRKYNKTINSKPQRIQTITGNNGSENKSKHRVNTLTRDVSCYCPCSVGLGNREFLELEVNSKVSDTNETDMKQMKRALVNGFLKSVHGINHNDARMKAAPKVDNSRVTININGDRERYDVLLEQSNFDTGLSVRKTLKKQSQTRTAAVEVDNSSMEKILMLSEEIKNAPMGSREMREISNAVTRPNQSNLHVKDSLEICHSREGRAASRPLPFKFKGKDGSRNMFNSVFKAPVKHYRGDNCLIPDPYERDKEIRELLGIVRNTRNSKKGELTGTKEHSIFYSHPEKQRRKDCCCFKKRISKGIMTRHSISKLAKKCLRKKSKYQVISITSRIQLQNHETKNNDRRGTQALQKQNEVFMLSPATSFNTLSGERRNVEDEQYEYIHGKQRNYSFCKNEDVTADIAHNESFSELNRNIQVFLQIEQFTKKTPIILTRKQYEKVKKSIQYRINHRKYNLHGINIVSVGEIKVKPRLQQSRYSRGVQTELPEIQRNVRCMQTLHNYKKHKINIHKFNQNEYSIQQCDKIISTTIKKYDKMVSTDDKNSNSNHNINEDVIEKHSKPYAVLPRQTVSSMEIHFAKVAFMKKITVSSTHFKDSFPNKINTDDINKPSPSIHTIFKGHRQSATPNLGTSVYSLCSDANESNKSFTVLPCAGDSKPKKPFLQRLLSCLVMRSTETTVMKEVPQQRLSNVNSSVDSYHINTSLGALEMTSTLYDTSASFYSNHTIVPTNKMKRGFFSSVRGFLTTRRS